MGKNKNDIVLLDAAKGVDEIVALIERAKERAFTKVNDELILLYFDVGRILSNAKSNKTYGDKFIDEVEKVVQSRYPAIKGFNRRGLYRMIQFYETYANDEIVSPLVTQLSWTHHLMILSASKSKEERQFYILKAIKERYSKRELERQINSAYYERFMLSKSDPNDKTLEPRDGAGLPAVLDSYVLEFLDLPEKFSEKDLRKAIVTNVRNFLLELGGKDFTYAGDEYRVQVGVHDYYIDLVFFNRELKCLVAIELKLGEFKPEYISKMNFYLEALDRSHKKTHENPSVGIILCAKKDNEVVEIALSRSLSPAAVAEYQQKLPDKKILRQRLQELISLLETSPNKPIGEEDKDL